MNPKTNHYLLPTRGRVADGTLYQLYREGQRGGLSGVRDLTVYQAQYPNRANQQLGSVGDATVYRAPDPNLAPYPPRDLTIYRAQYPNGLGGVSESLTSALPWMLLAGAAALYVGYKSGKTVGKYGEKTRNFVKQTKKSISSGIDGVSKGFGSAAAKARGVFSR